MTIKRSMSAQDERPLKRVDKKNRPKKEIDTGKEKGITLETPKTEEQKVSVKKEGDGAEAPKKKKNIIRVYHAHQPKMKHLQSQWHRQAHQRQSSL